MVNKKNVKKSFKKSKKEFLLKNVLLIVCMLAVCACSKDKDEDDGYYYPDYSGNSSYLSAPTEVSASANGSTVSLSWNAVYGATNYSVYHCTTPNGYYSFRTTVETTYATFTQESSGSHYYKIKAENSKNSSYAYSDYSAYAYVNVEESNTGGGNNDGGNSNSGDNSGDNSGGNTGGGTTVQKPSVPTGLSAVQNGETIVVSWNSVSNAYYYRLWYSTPSGQEDFTNVYAPSTSTVFSSNMKDGTYRFWIQALNSNYDASATSSKVSCTFKSSSSDNTGGGNSKSKLDTPKNLEAYSGGSFVQISFDEVSLAYQYELYRSTSATYGYTKISASGGSTSGKRYVLTDSNPKSGTTYYKVKAVALSSLGIANSDYSAYVQVTR